MKQINLFVDMHVLDGIPQGSVTFLAGLYSGLINDSRFQLFVGSKDRDIARDFIKSDNFIHIKYNGDSGLRRLLFTIPKILKEYRIDVAHFQYIIPLQKRCRYIVTIHDLLFLEFPEKFPLIYRIKNTFLFYLSAKRADIVTTVSEYSRNSIHHYFKMPLTGIKVTPNVFHQRIEKYEPVTELADKRFILYVSRIEPRKNQARLIKVWKELSLYNQLIDLVLVGVEGLKDKEFISELKLLSETQKNHFHWFTDVSNEKLFWLYQKCSLFVYPSGAEGFGIPPLEAAIFGAKVICSNTTAMNEFDFFGNFLFDPENYDEFKKAVEYGLKSNFNHELVISSILSKYNRDKISAEFGDMIFNF